jgi:hypothetical protein
MLNDFVLGFNEDESGRKVLDGIMNWISAGSGIGMNYRFSQSNAPSATGRTTATPRTCSLRQRIDDRSAHRKDSSRYRSARRPTPARSPSRSIWQRVREDGVVLHTTPDGSTDLPDSPFRNYFMTSMQHGTGSGTARGNCQQFQNPLSSNPVRALFLALDKWATRVPAPDSRVPKLADGR